MDVFIFPLASIVNFVIAEPYRSFPALLDFFLPVNVFFNRRSEKRFLNFFLLIRVVFVKISKFANESFTSKAFKRLFDILDHKSGRACFLLC